MSGNNEVMSHYFDTEEYDQVRSEAEKLGLAERQAEIESQNINLKLLALKERVETRTEDNFIERFKAYKTAVLEAEALVQEDGVVDNLANAAQDISQEAISSVSSAATNAVQEGLYSSVGNIKDNFITKIAGALGLGATVTAFLSENINPVSWLKSGFSGDGFLGWIGGLLGFKKDTTDTPIEDADGDDPATSTPGGTEDTNEPAGDVETGVDDINNNPGNSKFNIGSRLIIELNGSTSEYVALDHSKTYDGLAGYTYQEILDLSSNSIPNDFYDTEDIEKNSGFYTHSINSLQTQTTKDLLRIGLKESSLRRIITPYSTINPSLAADFGKTPEQGTKRLQEILDMLDNSNFDWKTDLSYKEISILYLASIPALKVPAIEGIGSLGLELNTLFFGEDGAIDTYGSSPYSPEFLEAFAKFGSYSLSSDSVDPEKDSETKQRFLQGVPPENHDTLSSEFDQLLIYKNYITSDKFYSDTRLGLTPQEQVLFKNNIGLAHIIVLQGIMGSGGTLENMSPLAFPPLVYTIGKILGRGETANKLESSIYLGRYVKDALLNQDGVFSEDESLVLKIYGEKILDIILLSHINSMVNLLGGTQGISGVDLNSITIGTLVGGAGVRIMGNTMIRGALNHDKISLPGIWLKRAGNIGILAGIALGGTNWYINNRPSQLSQDLESAENSGDILRIIATLQKQQDSVEAMQLDDGTEVKIFAYESDVPIYVIDGKIFELKTGSLNIIEQWKQSDQEISSGLSIATQAFLDLFSERTGTVDGTDYSIQRYENGNIVFGNGDTEKIIPASDIITESALSKPEVLGEDFVRQMTEGGRGLSILGFDIGDSGEKGYFLGKVNDNNFMFLSEVGSVEDMFTNPSVES